MIKVICTIKAAPHVDQSQFHRWFLEHYAPVLLKLSPQIRRYEVNIADMPCSKANQASYGGYDRSPPWDIIVEAWLHPLTDPMAFVTPGEPAKLALNEDLRRLTSEFHAYRVQEIVELDGYPTLMGRFPGMRNFSGVRFLPALSVADGIKLWEKHVGFTLTNLKAMESYTRNITETALTSEAPYFPGFGALDFPTLHEWEHIPFQPDMLDFLQMEELVLADCTRYRLR